jgi:hypothetical protein
MDRRRPPAAGEVPDTRRLRRATRLIGFRLQASDGPVGRVADVLIDAESGVIPALVVSPGRWPAGAKLTVSTKHVLAISGVNRRVFLTIPRRAIRACPRADATTGVAARTDGGVTEFRVGGGLA